MKKIDKIKFIVPSFVDLNDADSEGKDSQDNDFINPWFNIWKIEHEELWVSQ